MRQNIAIALITVTLLLLGVLLGGVTMSIGMLVHEASVLIVIVNAMRLLRRHGGVSSAPHTNTTTPSVTRSTDRGLTPATIRPDRAPTTTTTTGGTP